MSLLAWAFLAGLALLAVPLVLHRLKERSPAETTVSSLMLLREAEEPVRTRRALAHRVLLALRLAMLAALTLAFAQPVVDRVSAASADEADAPAELVVLDASLSMRRSPVWSEALDVVRDLRRDGRSRILLADDRLTAVADVADAAPGWSRLDFAGLPSRIEAALAAWETPRGGWRVHLVSDFQASAAPERFNALVEGLHWPLVLHRVGDGAPNWAVVAEVEGGRIRATVSSFAPVVRQLAVSLHRDGEAWERKVVAVPAGGRAPVAFDASPGSDVWEVRIDADDALAEDDVARVVPAAGDASRVAILATDTTTGAMRFLRAALDAGGFADPLLLDSGSPWPRTDVDCLIVVDPGALSAATRRRLQRYADDGGGVLMIAGPRTQRTGALPLGGEVAADVFDVERRVVVQDAGHPLAAGDWGEVTVDRVLRASSGAAKTILALAPTGRDRREAGNAPAPARHGTRA